MYHGKPVFFCMTHTRSVPAGSYPSQTVPQLKMQWKLNILEHFWKPGSFGDVGCLVKWAILYWVILCFGSFWVWIILSFVIGCCMTGRFVLVRFVCASWSNSWAYHACVSACLIYAFMQVVVTLKLYYILQCQKGIVINIKLTITTIN